MNGPEIAVKLGDIRRIEADVIALKFAQGLFGPDRAVAWALDKDLEEMVSLLPNLGSHVLLETNEKVAAEKALFVNVPSLGSFNYELVRAFARKVVELLATVMPDCRHLAMTNHGAGVGLDVAVSFDWQLAGLYDAIDSKRFPESLERITIVELDGLRFEQIEAALGTFTHERAATLESQDPPKPILERKKRVYAILSPSSQLDDFYEFGINMPAIEAGYECELAELPNSASGTGQLDTDIADILQRRRRIQRLLGSVSADELKTICFNLGVDYDNWEGQSKESLGRELVLYQERRGRVDSLIEELYKQLPLASPEDFPQLGTAEQLVFQSVRSRIDTSTIVVAELSSQDPNILFLVGYALGQEKNLVLILKEGSSAALPVEIPGTPRILFERIVDLNRELRRYFESLQ